MAKARGRDCHALTVDYGQRPHVEIEAAKNVAKAIGVTAHKIARVDLGSFGGSALTDDVPVPKDQDPAARGIPATYVPARNTVLLSLALAWAEVLCAAEIWIGVNAIDYSGYPDCRPEFIEAFQSLAGLATKTAVEGGQVPKIVAPLLEMGKREIVLAGVELGLDHGLTFSCYDPSDAGEPCGRCDACQLRRRGFARAGVVDPLAG